MIKIRAAIERNRKKEREKKLERKRVSGCLERKRKRERESEI